MSSKNSYIRLGSHVLGGNFTKSLCDGELRDYCSFLKYFQYIVRIFPLVACAVGRQNTHAEEFMIVWEKSKRKQSFSMRNSLRFALWLLILAKFSLLTRSPQVFSSHHWKGFVIKIEVHHGSLLSWIEWQRCGNILRRWLTERLEKSFWCCFCRKWTRIFLTRLIWSVDVGTIVLNADKVKKYRGKC